MAVAGASGDCARFNVDNSDSDGEFYGFDASEIEQTVRRQSDDDFHIDDDGLMSSDTDTDSHNVNDSDADGGDASVHGSSGEDSSDSGR